MEAYGADSVDCIPNDLYCEDRMLLPLAFAMAHRVFLRPPQPATSPPRLIHCPSRVQSSSMRPQHGLHGRLLRSQARSGSPQPRLGRRKTRSRSKTQTSLESRMRHHKAVSRRDTARIAQTRRRTTSLIRHGRRSEAAFQAHQRLARRLPSEIPSSTL